MTKNLSTAGLPAPQDIVAFWLGASASGPDQAEGQRGLWYSGGPAVDAEITARFGDLVEQACCGELSGWENSAEGALALVILLDQFTRNIYRGTVDAYRGDALARDVTRRAIDRGLDDELPVVGRIFLYHPYHHAEQLSDQDQAIRLLEALRDQATPQWTPYLQRSVEGFTGHRNIVARFGRFPHRNRVLGRVSTPEEVAYLDGGPETFGQG